MELLTSASIRYLVGTDGKKTRVRRQNHLRFKEQYHRYGGTFGPHDPGEKMKGYPRLSVFWDHNEHQMLVEDLVNELGVLSSGEAAMAQFFAAVWRWKNDNDDLDFDIVDCWSKLDREERTIVGNWLNAPLYPQKF
ncbi:hypothetical protein BEN30_10445 [Magnetovibrio blakemorei]|uniref:Uncharacterized protein n=2 Tax=Magnetovibrio blakemorei TaxID=28181 RepID=A0A1E5Q8R0_9PROT|nr:hypothetical protein BEN30_10445 [Magnetovibrio blakemorei]